MPSEFLDICAVDRAGRRRPADECRPGEALVATIPGEAYTASEIRARLLQIRSTIPWAPLVMKSGGGGLTLAATSLALECGARGVFQSNGSWDRIVVELNSTDRLADHVAAWLAAVRNDLPPRPVRRVRTLVDCGRNGQTVGRAAENLDIGPRALEDYFARYELPSPGRWLALGRLAVGLCHRQRDLTAGLIACALASRYSDAASFLRALKAFAGGLPPRRHLGWEHLAASAGLHQRA